MVRMAILFFISLGLCITCRQQQLKPVTSADARTVLLQTDKTVYHLTDTILVMLRNGTEQVVEYPVICAQMLDISFQKKEDENWRQISHLPLPDCPTKLRSLKPGSKITFKLAASLLGSVGEYRLQTNYRFKGKESEFLPVFSEAFTVEK